jgi:hypothetical protein
MNLQGSKSFQKSHFFALSMTKTEKSLKSLNLKILDFDRVMNWKNWRNWRDEMSVKLLWMKMTPNRRKDAAEIVEDLVPRTPPTFELLLPYTHP